ncbi:hypothetical protein M4I32_12585 [Microbacterium sp. LRZ72]|uniref:hypothetical protein n=1 Tax=Microbacterium sp. LRZ72 TaxID=2942481 RepID=UPI0029BAE476|nr:hypothetical protein [Microbacterium sp. LRZ72]MDX2377638.1 hypothetical protein [Microbacterium sp. LRZ72]
MVLPEFTSAQVSVSTVPAALFTLAGGFALCVLGYLFRALSEPISKVLRATFQAISQRRSEQTRSVAALYAVLAMGIAADALKVGLTGQFGYLGDATLVTIESARWYSQPLEIASTLKVMAIFGLSVAAFRSGNRRPARVLFPALLVAVPLSLATGMKEAFLDVVLAIVIPYVLMRARLKLVPLVLVGLLFVTVVTPFVTQLRLDVRGPEALSVDRALERTWAGALQEDGYFAALDPVHSGLQVLSRLRQVDNFAIISDTTPRIVPFQDSSAILVAPLEGVVPRVVWPDKPVRLAGYEFYKVYYQGQGQSSSAITPQGSLYMHGGLGVLFVGMFFIGVFVRALDDGLQARGSTHAALFLLLIAPVVVKQEMDVPGFLAALPIVFVTWVVGIIALFPSRSWSIAQSPDRLHDRPDRFSARTRSTPI